MSAKISPLAGKPATESQPVDADLGAVVADGLRHGEHVPFVE